MILLASELGIQENVKNWKREHLVILSSPLHLQPPSKALSPLAYRPAMSLIYPLPFLCTSTIQTLSIGRAPLPFSPSAASNPRQRRARRYRRNQSSRDLALASPGLSSPGRLQPAAYSISRLAASVKLSPASRNFSKQTSAPPLPDPSCQMAGARDET